jgi:hypothetical protein
MYGGKLLRSKERKRLRAHGVTKKFESLAFQISEML